MKKHDVLKSIGIAAAGCFILLVNAKPSYAKGATDTMQEQIFNAPQTLSPLPLLLLGSGLLAIGIFTRIKRK